MDLQELYDLKLGEVKNCGKGRAYVRVPDGWIFETLNGVDGIAAVFIPEPPPVIITNTNVDYDSVNTEVPCMHDYIAGDVHHAVCNCPKCSPTYKAE